MITDGAKPETRAYARHGRPDDPDSRASPALGATGTALSRRACGTPFRARALRADRPLGPCLNGRAAHAGLDESPSRCALAISPPPHKHPTSLTWDMSPRRSHLVLLLVAALAAMALSASAVDADSEHGSRAGKVGDAGFAVRAPQIDASAARLTSNERRDAGTSERSSKQGSVLFVLAAATLAVSVLGRRRASLLAHRRSLSILSWWPQTGRAPPSLQLLSA